jgi:cold shock CspA family protein
MRRLGNPASCLASTANEVEREMRPAAALSCSFLSADDPNRSGGGKDVFVHISAVERAGLSNLNEGAKVSYEEKENRGKMSAENLKVK